MQVLGLAVADCQQVQFMVAQHRDGPIPQFLDETQALQRLRATVDQVPGKPEPVPGRVKTDYLKQVPEFVETTLEIADGIDRHGLRSGPSGNEQAAGQCNVSGVDRLNTGIGEANSTPSSAMMS